MYIRGTRVCISGVRGYVYPGYEDMYIRGTRVCISGVRGYVYPGYEAMYIRLGILLIASKAGIYTLKSRRIHDMMG